VVCRRFEPERAVEIVGPTYGSGYRIGGRLVLTVAHLFPAGVGSGCQVRSKPTFGTVAATVAWIAPGADIALVALPDTVASCEPAAFGALPAGPEKVCFDLYGWPKWAQTARPDKAPKAGGRHIDGLIYLADTSPDGLLVLEPTRVPEAPAPDKSGSDWEGLSGAAVICDGLVVAVQRQHQNPRRPASLEAEPLARVYGDEGWQSLLEQQGVIATPENVRPVPDNHLNCVQILDTNDQYYRRNRPAMLQNVRNCWVKGMLEQSLYAVARLELGLTIQPDAVEDVWNVLVQRPEQTPQPLPPGTRISTAFDDFGHALLILGAPGTGKTTLLLELTKDLLARAEQEPNHPVPVVFNLSSWAVRQSPLAAWLVDELCERYYVPRKHAQIWIDKDLILPLLDGLDEVAPEHRSACAEAINAFRQQHGLVPIAVCSRLADYEALAVKLRLQGALVVQALTRPQIDRYLTQAGARLAGLRTTVQNDETLWELLDTPLMLSVAALAYQGHSAAEVQIAGTLEERKTQLFAAYTDAMFERRGKATLYSRQQTMQWLIWLAAAMAQHNQSIFYIEWMQPDWLPTRQQPWVVTLGEAALSGLIFGLAGGLVFGLVVGLNAGLVFGLDAGLVGSMFGLVFGPVFGLVLGPAFGLVYVTNSESIIHPAETLTWHWSRLIKRLVAAWLGGLTFGLGMGLFAGLASGLVGGLDAGLKFGLFAGLVGGLVSGLDGVLHVGLDLGLVGLFFGSVVGVGGWLLNDIQIGEITTRARPNEGIWRSLHNALLSGLAGGLVGGLVAGLVAGLTGLASGWIFGLVVGLKKGGRACLQHLILRILLWGNGFAPWRYVRFLDYAAERVFLRKVGGGYIFVHRMLLEYFAALHPSHHASLGQAPVSE